MNSQDSHGVGGSGALSPPSDDDHVVSRGDELAPLAKVDGVLHSGVHVVHPGSLGSGLVVEQRDTAAVELELPGHLVEPGDGQDGTLRLVLADQVGGGPAGGQHDDGRGLALVGGHHAGDGGGGGVVTGPGVLQNRPQSDRAEMVPVNRGQVSSLETKLFLIKKKRGKSWMIAVYFNNTKTNRFPL